VQVQPDFLKKTEALRSRFAIRNITRLSLQHGVVITFLTVVLQYSAIGFPCVFKRAS
jgi:hypothetical protein